MSIKLKKAIVYTVSSLEMQRKISQRLHKLDKSITDIATIKMTSLNLYGMWKTLLSKHCDCDANSR